MFPNFKATINSNYQEVKDQILKNIYNQKYKLKTNQNKLSENDINKKIEYYEYFCKIINNIDGTLEEKVCHALNQYEDILKKKKETLLEYYDINKKKDTILAKKFSERRNKISHGESTDKFNDSEITAYILLRMCIYCMVLERCNFNADDINRIVNKIFN